MIDESQSTECSISLRKLTNCILPQKLFSQKKKQYTACAYIAPSFIFAGTRSGAIYRWTIPEELELQTTYPTFEVNKHQGEISFLVYSEDLKLLFSGSSDRRVYVWQMNSISPSTEPYAQLAAFEETPLDLITFNNFIFVIEHCGISVYMHQTMKNSMDEKVLFRKVYFIKSKSSPFNCMCFSPNFKVDNSGYLYVGLENGTILQYDARMSDKPVFANSSPPRRISECSIFSLSYFPKNDVIFIFSYDNLLRVFNPRNNRVVTTIKNDHFQNFVNASSDNDTTYIITDVLGYIYIWEIGDTTHLIHKTRFSESSVGVFPASGSKYLYLQRDKVSLFDVNRGIVKVSYLIHKGTVFYIQHIQANSGSRIATVGDDKFIRLFDSMDYSLRQEYKCPTGLAILSAYVGIKEKQDCSVLWAVTGHDEGKLFFVNLTDDKVVELPSRHKNSISSISVVYNLTNILMFSCDYDGVVSVWSIDSVLESISYAAVSLLRVWKAHDCEILASGGNCNFETCMLATGGNDNVIKIWSDAENGASVQLLNGHTDSVTSLVFEGFFLFSGSEDMTIRIWDVANGVQLFVLNNMHKFAIRNIFCIDGDNEFASCDVSGEVFLYDYIKKSVQWSAKHSADCKCIYVDKPNSRILVCIKGELVPHYLPRSKVQSGLPKLASPQSSANPTR